MGTKYIDREIEKVQETIDNLVNFCSCCHDKRGGCKVIRDAINDLRVQRRRMKRLLKLKG